MTVKATYHGEGSDHIYGVPARSLDLDDWATLTPEQQQAVGTARSGGKLLYHVHADPGMTTDESVAAEAPAGGDVEFVPAPELEAAVAESDAAPKSGRKPKA